MEHNDKYEARLMQRAEEMARMKAIETFKNMLGGEGSPFLFDENHPVTQETVRETVFYFMDLARLAVRWEAEAFKEASSHCKG